MLWRKIVKALIKWWAMVDFATDSGRKLGIFEGFIKGINRRVRFPSPAPFIINDL